MLDNEEIKKLVLVKEKGIEILDDELYKKVSRGNLSASMTNSLLSCPADWLLDKYILREIEHDEQPHLERGTLFHSVMESFFRIPAGMRTPKELGTIVVEETKLNHPHLMADEDSKAWLKNAVMGYLSMGFDFNNEIIPTLEWKGKNQYGLELFVDGKIGDTKRKVVGFVDKLVEKEVNGEKKLFIEDWKTGKQVHPYNPDKPTSSSNSFDYWRQQTLYAMLMEQQGLEIEGASLIFPVAKKIVEVDHKREDVRQHVIDDMIKVDKRLDKCLEQNFFPFTPDTFCTWCHLLYGGKKKGRPRFPRVNQNELNQLLDYED